MLHVSSTLVSFAAVIRVVTQRSSERCVTSDDPNNGCKGDYLHPDRDFKLLGSLSIHEDDNDDNKNKKQFFLSKAIALNVHHTGKFLQRPLHDCNVKLFNAKRWTHNGEFLFLFLYLDTELKNSTPGKFAYMLQIE